MASKGKGSAPTIKQDQRVFGMCPNCQEQKVITNVLMMRPVEGSRGMKNVWTWKCSTCDTEVVRNKRR